MIFITGASSTGKSTLINGLKGTLPIEKYAIHDIDEADLWTNDYPAWRQAKIDYWLHQSIDNQKQGVETILCGIIYPDNVSSVPSYSPKLSISYILLYASADVISERFNSRYSDEMRATMSEDKLEEMESRRQRQIKISMELISAYKQLPDTITINTTGLKRAVVLEEALKLIRS